MSKGHLADLHAEMKVRLNEQREETLANLQPLYEQRDALVLQMQPLEAQLRDLQQQIKVAEGPLRDAGNDLATIARAEGARTLTNEGPAQPETFVPDSPEPSAPTENAAGETTSPKDGHPLPARPRRASQVK